MAIRKEEWFETIFGKDFEVIVYPEKAQHLTHISIIANPEDIQRIKEILYDTRRSNKQADS